MRRESVGAARFPGNLPSARQPPTYSVQGVEEIFKRGQLLDELLHYFAKSLEN